MQKDQIQKRFLSIRLTESELRAIYRQYKRSGCRSLTEYAKKILLKNSGLDKTPNTKPIKTRNAKSVKTRNAKSVKTRKAKSIP